MSKEQTSTQLAEKLARKCAGNLFGLHISPKAILRESQVIIDQTALVELLECAASLRRVPGFNPTKNCNCHSCKSQNALNAKLKEILGGDVE